jgi:hypothetical protein
MNILELFAGSGSIGNVARARGHNVISSDINSDDKVDYINTLFGEEYLSDDAPFRNIDYPCNILDFDYKKIPFIPDLIWSSPPCQGFSVCAIGKNWNRDYSPKSHSARLGIKLLEKTIEIIRHYNPKYYFIENPRGMMRMLPIMQQFKRNTVTYCQYGDRRQKPTDIWNNSNEWSPRPACKAGDPCHEAAPRGSKTGTQGIDGAYDRSRLPEELCIEIIKSCEGKL